MSEKGAAMITTGSYTSSFPAPTAAEETETSRGQPGTIRPEVLISQPARLQTAVLTRREGWRHQQTNAKGSAVAARRRARA